MYNKTSSQDSQLPHQNKSGGPRQEVDYANNKRHWFSKDQEI